MNILNKEEALKQVDGTRVSGLVLMGSYDEAPTKNGGSFLAGNLQALGDVPFKVWSGNCFNMMVATDFSNTIVKVDADVNEYGGAKSLILVNIYPVEESELQAAGISEVDFLSSRYNIESYWGKLNEQIKRNVSTNAYKVYEMIMNAYIDKFKTEFAAISYHDNCKGGLLAHTTKVVNICGILKMYSNISARVSDDALYVGAAIHDIGKVLEYSNGTISEMGKYISHNTIGILILQDLKDDIVSLKGEEYFNILLSIVSQHHGEYGDRPRTIAAYIIHQFDLLDSSLTLLNQTLGDSPSGQVRFDGLKLI